MTATLTEPDVAEPAEAVDPAPVVKPIIVDTPGVYDMTDDQYHGDPIPGGSLSFSGSKKLLLPYCPAIYRYEADNPGEHKRHFDFGHAAHLEMLGAGPEIVPVDAKDWRKKDAQTARDEAYAEGKVPLLTAEVEQIKAMGRALRADPLCAALLNPDHGVAEQSLFWIDPDFDVWRRARIDFMNSRPGRRVKIVDYKSTTALDPDSLSRTVNRWGYHCQDQFYRDGVRELEVAEDPAFLFICQLKTPPYLVQVVQLDDEALRIGRERNRAAIERFRDCQRSGIWPGYSPDPLLLSLPRYADRQWENEQAEAEQ